MALMEETHKPDIFFKYRGTAIIANFQKLSQVYWKLLDTYTSTDGKGIRLRTTNYFDAFYFPELIYAAGPCSHKPLPVNWILFFIPFGMIIDW